MFCLHSVLVCFVRISEQIAIISLYSTNYLISLKACGYYMYHQFNIHTLYVLPTQCIDVFCMVLRKNSDYFPIQH